MVYSFALKVARIRGVRSGSNQDSRIPERLYVFFSILKIREPLPRFLLTFGRYGFFGELSQSFELRRGCDVSDEWFIQKR